MSRPLIQPEPIHKALKRLAKKLDWCSDANKILVYFENNKLSTVSEKAKKFNEILENVDRPIIGIYTRNFDIENIYSDIQSYYAEFQEQTKKMRRIPIYVCSNR